MERGNALLLLGVTSLAAAAVFLLYPSVVSAQGSDESAGGPATDDDGEATMSGNGFNINNPGNLRYIASNPWNGQTGNHNGYGVYSSLQYGVRAAYRQLGVDYSRGLTTIGQIIPSWAPSSENDTGSYISDVVQYTGIDSDQELSFPADQAMLALAIFHHENGDIQNLDTTTVQEWGQS